MALCTGLWDDLAQKEQWSESVPVGLTSRKDRIPDEVTCSQQRERLIMTEGCRPEGNGTSLHPISAQDLLTSLCRIAACVICTFSHSDIFKIETGS